MFGCGCGCAVAESASIAPARLCRVIGRPLVELRTNITTTLRCTALHLTTHSLTCAIYSSTFRILPDTARASGTLATRY
jgi:hypothetical protein